MSDRTRLNTAADVSGHKTGGSTFLPNVNGKLQDTGSGLKSCKEKEKEKARARSAVRWHARCVPDRWQSDSHRGELSGNFILGGFTIIYGHTR